MTTWRRARLCRARRAEAWVWWRRRMASSLRRARRRAERRRRRRGHRRRRARARAAAARRARGALRQGRGLREPQAGLRAHHAEVLGGRGAGRARPDVGGRRLRRQRVADARGRELGRRRAQHASEARAADEPEQPEGAASSDGRAGTCTCRGRRAPRAPGAARRTGTAVAGRQARWLRRDAPQRERARVFGDVFEREIERQASSSEEDEIFASPCVSARRSRTATRGPFDLRRRGTASSPASGALKMGAERRGAPGAVDDRRRLPRRTDPFPLRVPGRAGGARRSARERAPAVLAQGVPGGRRRDAPVRHAAVASPDGDGCLAETRRPRRRRPRRNRERTRRHRRSGRLARAR